MFISSKANARCVLDISITSKNEVTNEIETKEFKNIPSDVFYTVVFEDQGVLKSKKCTIKTFVFKAERNIHPYINYTVDTIILDALTEGNSEIYHTPITNIRDITLFE